MYKVIEDNVQIPEDIDTAFGFHFKVIDYGQGGFQVVQSDNQQIITNGMQSTIGDKGGLKTVSQFGAVSLYLANKGGNGIDTFIIEGELMPNIKLF